VPSERKYLVPFSKNEILLSDLDSYRGIPRSTATGDKLQGQSSRSFLHPPHYIPTVPEACSNDTNCYN